MSGVWLGWITMRGDDGPIDNILTNPNRRTRLHRFNNQTDRTALCGVVRPTDDSNLGVFGESEPGATKCRRCRLRPR